MIASEHILISLESRHAENILSGRKRVELRRRSMRISPGATVWMYVKLPVGSIIGRATVRSVDLTTPLKLWRRYGTVSGLSRREFFEYFEGVDSGVALILEEEVRLKKPFSLKALREFDEDFQPPQFFARLTPGHPLHSAVAACA